jgi:hypothetical protein
LNVRARAVLAAALLTCACGATFGSLSPASPSVSLSSPSVGTRTLLPAPSGSPALVVVTRTDDGGTITLHVGDNVEIALGEQYQWKLEPPDGAVLSQSSQALLLRQGIQAIWLAKAPGRSTIKAAGSPTCTSGQACPSSVAATFTATVNVLP